MAIGLSPASKGSVYRRLSRLRGIHVDWEPRSFRSLRLLNSEVEGNPIARRDLASRGRDHLTLPLKQSEVLQIIRLIATGLVQGWSKEWNDRANYCPEVLQRGLNKLAVMCLQHGKEFPRNLPEAIALFQLQFKDWPLPMVPSELDESDVLLIEDIPSDLCYELTVDSTTDSGERIVDELDEEAMLEVREQCRLLSRQDIYIRVRKFLIKNPVLSVKDFLHECNALPQRIRQAFESMYEYIPASVVTEGQIEKCSFCGWTLSITQSGKRRCATQLCYVRTRGFGRIVKTDTERQGVALRVKQGIVRYVVIPGLSELRLERRLARFGLDVKLWPNYDTFDLFVLFPSGETWAVDVKDWANPFLLGSSLKEFSKEPAWNRAFLVVPNHRASMRNRYAKAFEAAQRGRGIRVEFAIERQFLRFVNQRLMNKDTHA